MPQRIKYHRAIYCFKDLVESDLVKEDAGDSVEGVDRVDDDHEDEPEPHGQVHLLVDDVLQCQCQHVAIVVDIWSR